MTDDDKALVERLRGDWPEILVEKHWMMDSDAIDMQREEAADRIEAQAAEIERLRAENLHLRSALAGIANAMAQYTTVANMHVDAIGKGVRERARIALANHTDAGQPWLRTYDAHLKGTNNAE